MKQRGVEFGLDHNCGHNVTGSVPPIAGFSSTIRGMPATDGTSSLRTAKYGRNHDQALFPVPPHFSSVAVFIHPHAFPLTENISMLIYSNNCFPFGPVYTGIACTPANMRVFI